MNKGLVKKWATVAKSIDVAKPASVPVGAVSRVLLDDPAGRPGDVPGADR